jgi:ABC-2 type transport system permease protein
MTFIARLKSSQALGVQTWVQCQRLLIRWLHDPRTVVQALITPLLFLVALHLVFGKPVSAITGHSALYGSVPLAALVGAVFGSSAAGIALMGERDQGMLARLWVMPIQRMSGLLSRLGAEAVRVLATAIVVLVAGLALGLRLQQGVAATAAWLLIPVLFGVAYACLVISLAVRLTNTVLAEATGLGVALLFFYSTGFVPLAAFPDAIQPVVQHQPMSYAVEAMRGLSLGGPVLVPVLGTLLWSAGIVAVCAGPMMTGYRTASMR